MHIVLFCRLRKNTSPIDYIDFIHKSLSKICKESGFEGLDYYAGPEIMCEGCDEMIVLPCVEYEGEGALEPELECEGCYTEYDVNNIMVSLLHFSSKIYCLLLTQSKAKSSSSQSVKGTNLQACLLFIT